MKKVYVTRRARFSAAHSLIDKTLYGKCANIHGHNYQLYVTVSGLIDPQEGMVIHLSVLDDIIHQHLISKLDHAFLNKDVDFLKGQITTLENMVCIFWDILKVQLPDSVELYELIIQETENNSVKYRGE